MDQNIQEKTQHSDEPQGTQSPKMTPPTKWSLVSLSMEMGFIIALPLVALGLLGKNLDARMGNEVPWMTLIGIALAIFATTIWLTKKFKNLMK